MNENNLIQIKPRTFVSRSAILEHFTCPYKHYLTYWANGTGVHPARHSLDLLIGSVVHRGLQHLFEHCRVEHPNGDFTETCVDEAVEVARELWEKELGKKGLALKNSAEYDRLDWIIAEQECLWEGLIRAFAIRRLPAILEEYDILEVEFEEVFEGFSPFITFLGKADGLFMRKSDKALVILSIKTSSEYAEVTTRNILHDMQGVSETYLAQERLERHAGTYLALKLKEDQVALEPDEYKFMQQYKWLEEVSIPPKIFAVQYEYLIKGKRRKNTQDENDNDYYQQSFLCHPMKFDAIRRIMLGKGGSSINPAQYKWKWGKGRQPKGWERCDIWSDIGIKNWIEMLATGQVQSELGHPFDYILHTPDLIVRSEMELKEWLVSTRFKAETIRSYINELEQQQKTLEHFQQYNVDGKNTPNVERILEHMQELIWRFFPKNTLNCHDYYGGDCHFVQHCHELESIDDMLTAESLTKRIPHHELEKEMFIKEGLIEEDD